MPVPVLIKLPEPADHPGKVRARVVIARCQRGCAQGDAAISCQRSDRLVEDAQIKGRSGGHRECGLRGEGVNRPGPQGPTVYHYRSNVGVSSRQCQRSCAHFG